MRKNESTGWKVLKQLFNVLNFWVCPSFPYTQTGTDCNDESWRSLIS